jgi:antitoxin component of MazEF toxin-antitoxin module
LDIKNLMGKLKTADTQPGATQPVIEDQIAHPVPQVPKVIPQIPQPPRIQPQAPVIQREMSNAQDDHGITLDLGEGISLVIPIQKRMSLSDFLKVAEKVKALELLSEEAEHRGQSPLYER